ncbi:MAG: peroxiredoxin family protein [Desulfomonilia bacterium]
MGKYYGVLFILAVYFVLPGQLWAQSTPDSPNYEQALEKLRLYVPEDAFVRKDLGLKEKSGQFHLGQIDAEIVIIEIFSMYCPHCQKHAPTTNALYELITSRKDLKNKVKFIGIGVGNSPYEVKIFREKYSIAFPLFDDRDSAATNALSGVVTPYYFGIRIHKDASLRVFYAEAGAFDDPSVFLDMILKAAAQSTGDGS